MINEVIIMKLIVCLDDNNGMMFNKRRQSRDRVLIENVFKDIIKTAQWADYLFFCLCFLICLVCFVAVKVFHFVGVELSFVVE